MKTHSLIYAAATFLLASCGGATQQQSAQKEVKIPEERKTENQKIGTSEFLI